MQEQVKNQKHADGTPAKKMEAHEAANANQARGMDTQAMIPVLAMIAELLSITLFRWVSVPDLKYTPYSTVGKIWKLEDVAEGLAWNYQTPESMTRAADQMAMILRIGVIISLILGIAFILYAFHSKVKAVRLGRIAFLWNTLLTAAALWWATDANMALNILSGRSNSFMNLTIYSKIQLTAASYLMIVLAILIVPFMRKLLDTRKEYAAEYYQTRVETEDHGIGKRTILAFALILTAIPAVIFFGIFFLNDRSDYFISLCIIILSMLPFFLVFENRRPQAREVVVIAVMAGLAVSRPRSLLHAPALQAGRGDRHYRRRQPGRGGRLSDWSCRRLRLELLLRAGPVDAVADVFLRYRRLPGRTDFPKKARTMEAFSLPPLSVRRAVRPDCLWHADGYRERIHGNGRDQ